MASVIRKHEQGSLQFFVGPEQGSDRPTLFEMPSPPVLLPFPRWCARVQRPDRYQVRMLSVPLDALLAEDHQARMPGFVEAWTSRPCTIPFGRWKAGRCDPIYLRILMALWLYATLDGVDRPAMSPASSKSTWPINDLRRRSANYHTLSDFRTANVKLLDDLLTNSVAALMQEGLVSMNRVAQDGMRVRANAGSSSFRRGETLRRLEQEARDQSSGQPGVAGRSGCGQQAAEGRPQLAARNERLARVTRRSSTIQEAKSPKKKDKARASTTTTPTRGS